MSFSRLSDQQYAPTRPALTRDQTRGVFGQVMGLVALTLGCTALGAYIGRDFTGGTGILFLLAMFACIIGLQAAAARGHEQLAIALLFALGLTLGIFLGPVLAVYAKADPTAVYQAAGATGAFVAALGSYGYASRRDLSAWARPLFFALMVLLLFVIAAIFIAIPGANLIWAIGGLVVFGGFTVLDFNRLRRTSTAGAVPIAASIFLDVFNVFLFFLTLFGGGGSRR
ncbi:MAG: Bax inhibitor-1/YccA family protein [Solirubrobacteraceae bacterium]